MKYVSLDRGKLIITFPYDPSLVKMVKELTGRRWHSQAKHWTADLDVMNVRRLITSGFSLSLGLQKWYANAISAPSPRKNLIIPGLKKELYPHQKEAVGFIEQKNGRALIADSMGLGKTATVLAWLQLNKNNNVLPAIVVCPSSMKLTWQKEVSNWTELTSRVWEGRISNHSNGTPELSASTDIHIINYDILASKVKDEDGKEIIKVRSDISGLKPKTVIIDEAHMCKDLKSQRTKAVLDLCKTASHVIALSGTPILNRPVEIYPILKAVAPQLFPSFTKFAYRYCAPVYNGYGWDFRGASNIKELYELLTERVMIRRLKQDVLKDLPPKIRSVIPLEIDNRDEYDKAASDLIAWFNNIDPEKAKAAERAEALVKFEALKQLTARGKLAGVIEWIRNFLESEEKLVVFANHKAIIDALAKEFEDIAVKLDGSCSDVQRQQAVDSFQDNPDIKLFIGNIQAAGVGITLTAASSTCFVEEPWSPSIVDQAEDRVHRIGQEADSVNAYHLVARKTIEEDIIELLDKKRQIISQALDGREVEDSDLLKELMKRWKK